MILTQFIKPSHALLGSLAATATFTFLPTFLSFLFAFVTFRHSVFQPKSLELLFI